MDDGADGHKRRISAGAIICFVSDVYIQPQACRETGHSSVNLAGRGHIAIGAVALNLKMEESFQSRAIEAKISNIGSGVS